MFGFFVFLLLAESHLNHRPVHYVPKLMQVVGAAVLIIKIVRVFPDIKK